MVPRKLNVMYARFPYGGNGGIESEHPDVCDWVVDTTQKMRTDERVGDILRWRRADTPITMCRNHSVLAARDAGADVLLMIDSDMGPDGHLRSNPNHRMHINHRAKPFWDVAFDFICKHWEKGPVVVGAPYCGPPPEECVYVFGWQAAESKTANPSWRLGMYQREHAAGLSGIQEVAALPTGLIAFDMRIFDYLQTPWFYYEYEGDGPPCPACGHPAPGVQAKKCSTEDVVLTRDASLIATERLGYNPLYCAWDSWAIHYKPKPVPMPVEVSITAVNARYRRAFELGREEDEVAIEFNAPEVLGDGR